jgi:predicted nucleotide-binding protein
MTYYHVRITAAGVPHDEVRNDLDEETLERQVLTPYRSGEPLTINGKTLTWDKVERVRVSVSQEKSAQIVERLRADDRRSRMVTVGGPGYEWRAAAHAQDVTDEFITGPPGSEPLTQSLPNTANDPLTSVPVQDDRPVAPTNAVFVVAGRDSRAASAIGDFLRALGLRVIEWEHAVAKTGLPNPYVGDVVQVGLRLAGAALVLLTPDDLVQLRADLVRDDDGVDEREVRGQARPNVYYEAGISDALGRERTVIVEIGQVKSFSDAAGRSVVRYDGSAARRHALAERLRVAGLTVDTAGQDWLNAGDVGQVLAAGAEATAAGYTSASGVTIDREALIVDIDTVLQRHADLKAAAVYDDLSDMPDESLDLAFTAQALVDRVASGSSYVSEAARVRDEGPHVRIPILMAVLRSLRSEAAKSA